MWFGTINGLNRYDGATMKIYLADLNDSRTISNNGISEIFEGLDGDLWFKNEAAIFNVYLKDKGVFVEDFDAIKNRYKLKSKEISKVFAESQDRFWFLHPYDGLSIYNRSKDESLYLISKSTLEGSLSHNNVTDIQEDPTGNFWLVYDNGTIDILSGNSLKVIHHVSIDEIVGLNQNYNLKLKLDKDGDAWVYCPNYAFGVFLIDNKELTITAINEGSEGIQLNNSLVKTILPHSNGMVWIGTDHGGINIVNKNKKEVKYLLNVPDNPNSLSHDAVYALLEDDQGIVWIGTHKRGIELYHPQSSRFGLVRRDIDPSNPFPKNDVNAFEEGASGEIYIGSNGGGLWKYSPKNGAITDIVKLGTEVIPDNLVIVDMLTDHKGVLWLGTYQNGLYALDNATLTHYKPDLDNLAGLKDSNVWNIFEDSKNRLWTGTLREGLFWLDRENKSFVQYTESGGGLPLNNLYITGIAEDDNANIWVAGINGIDVFNPETGYQKHYPGNSQDSSGLSSNEVSDLIKDKHGIIWVSTNKGLCYFDEQTSRFIVFNQSNGLNNEFLVSLVVDNVGDLWLDSQEGLIHAKINRTEPLLTAEFRFFNSGDGLQGDYYYKNAIFLSKKGNVFFGGSDGFNFVDPSSFPFYDDESQVVFSEFQLFNKTVSVNEQINGRILLKGPLDKNGAIKLNHDENIFSVSFSSMNQYSVSEVAYKEGFNNAKYFSKHFKNNYGTLPSQYQKNNHDA